MRDYSAILRCGSFSEKNIEKKHLCSHDKNYYYFCKSSLGKIVGFLKYVGEIQQLVRKRSQENNSDVVLHYISFPI